MIRSKMRASAVLARAPSSLGRPPRALRVGPGRPRLTPAGAPPEPGSAPRLRARSEPRVAAGPWTPGPPGSPRRPSRARARRRGSAPRSPVARSRLAAFRGGWAARSRGSALRLPVHCVDQPVDVPVLSVREGWLDTSDPVRPLLVAIFGWVAEQERARLIERTKAGLERARRQGKRLGRPPKSPILLHAAHDLVVTGVPVAEAARWKGVARSTLQRFMRTQTQA